MAKSMLIVDDQRMVSDALRMILTFDGYEVQSAENGREALAIFEVGKFDLVFTDFEMPEMNGHELASIIKSRDPLQPIIMVTAYADMVADMTPVPQVDLDPEGFATGAQVPILTQNSPSVGALKNRAYIRLRDEEPSLNLLNIQ
jgi:CheY-like chemotaxis protein